MSVGLNSLFDDLTSNVNNQVDNYPPYNISRSDKDDYTIVFAIAGFKMEEISVTMEYNKLTVSGSKAPIEDTEGADDYLYRGLSFRDFSRIFTLGEHIEVYSATLDNGLLTIQLFKNVPEELQPRTIPILESKSTRELPLE
jgi:molecular chaperone IbpA